MLSDQQISRELNNMTIEITNVHVEIIIKSWIKEVWNHARHVRIPIRGNILYRNSA